MASLPDRAESTAVMHVLSDLAESAAVMRVSPVDRTMFRPDYNSQAPTADMDRIETG